MEEIDLIYKNNIGMAFYWKACTNKSKIQVIFKDVGFLLNTSELFLFSSQCQQSLLSSTCSECGNDNCKSYLLKTPSSKIDLAVSKNELKDIDDLLVHTVDKVTISQLLRNIHTN
ncbi:hypothetical protein NBT05_04515 [Aquimarina sp. ERC-38]|uniref:hypothetical protein n=1 Tax=Aquimarina sp. ERC-38 TaxID=2949996 RepID=UPI002245C33D|nr:hypothetical protein [Aquimarina sp. ERC-38]UZO81734.1 hypothetical protein NBT05_04515 [Aquimarina sp. ERC-38]